MVVVYQLLVLITENLVVQVRGAVPVNFQAMLGKAAREPLGKEMLAERQTTIKETDGLAVAGVALEPLEETLVVVALVPVTVERAYPALFQARHFFTLAGVVVGGQQRKEPEVMAAEATKHKTEPQILAAGVGVMVALAVPVL